MILPSHHLPPHRSHILIEPAKRLVTGSNGVEGHWALEDTMRVACSLTHPLRTSPSPTLLAFIQRQCTDAGETSN
jgi:hypothetical protein